MAKGAKRKAAKRSAARRKAVTTRRRVGRTRSAERKAAAKKTASARKKTASRKTASARKKPARKSAPVKRLVKRAAPAAKKAAKAAAPTARKRTAPAKKKEAAPVRTAPGLNRERRVIRDDDIVPTPPSSLDFDRSASAARSGRRELRDRYDEHTETSPALTGGDVDADWESAYSVGDEAPGGDNPTPDQDLVDDIGRAVGVEYQDNEELKGDAKIAKRDRNRWELDPASSDDWDER